MKHHAASLPGRGASALRRRCADLFWLLLTPCLVFSLVFAPWAQRDAAAGFLGFGEFSVKDEAELGKKFNLLIRSHLPLIEDPEIAGYVKDLVDRLVKGMPPQTFAFKTSVIQHNAVNAFAAPAGFIFVHSGLILNFDSEAEVAGVLAHELAHVSQRHIAHRIERMQTISILSIAGMLAGAMLGGKQSEAIMVGSAAAGQAAMLKYSRDDESEADQVGMNYLTAAGYPPNGLIGGFKKIQKLQWLGGAGTIPPYLSTHPALQERVGYLEQRVLRLPDNVKTRKEDNARFKRVQTLLRARYSDPKTALQYFQIAEAKGGWLDVMGKAIVYERLNQYNQAREAFAKAQALSKDDPLLLRELAIFAYKTGDAYKAEYLLQRVVIERKDDLMAMFFYARLLGDQNHVDQASTYFERILNKIPDDSEVHYYYGRILGQAGKIFPAHLHLTYSALYANNQKQTKYHREQTERVIRTPEERSAYEKLKKDCDERAEFW
jgi:predicted Zn-dependent protease